MNILRIVPVVLLLVLAGCSLHSADKSSLHAVDAPPAEADQEYCPAQDGALGITLDGELPLSTGVDEPAVTARQEDDSFAADATEPAQEESPDDAALAAEDDTGSENQDLMNTALDFYRASQEYWNSGTPEEALDALDQAYSLIVEVDAQDRPELIQQKEDLRFMISKRILEIYAARHTAVDGLHKAIPLTMNEHVKKEIRIFQGPEREFFLQSYRRSGMYRARIVKELREAGMPEELSWLPLIESGFKVRALSRARALGLWQFIPSTGYKFGLTRDRWVDERLDPEKSTLAAIEYMKELHGIFGDWTTVLAAYNCGEGNVLKVIRAQKVNYLDNFWDLYERLPRETARYVPRFLAVLHILQHPEKYGFDLEDPEAPLAYESVSIEKQVQLKSVAEKLDDVSFQDLSELNPELRQHVTPTKPYVLKVPEGTGETLLASIDDIPRWSPPKRSYVYHRVRRGENLGLIAMKYRTSVRAIARANNIRRTYLIRAGRLLRIPLRGGASVRSVPKSGRYRVRRGDSLWLIARRFGTSTSRLRRLNGMSGSRLYPGQVIRVR
jgi:membrane-bound lytic murein transglycosylase D